MYEFSRHKAKPMYRLAKRKGDPFPTEAKEDDWELMGTEGSISKDIESEISAKGYHLYKFVVTFQEMTGHGPPRR
jgi:hypothetical protein